MKRFALLTLALFSMLACLTTSSSASAQSNADRKAAYELYKRGVQAYKKGEFKAAAKHLEQAAEIHKNPVVYYNLSLTYSKLGRSEDALEASEVAASMSEDMPAKTALKNEARIKGYRASIAGKTTAQAISRDRAERLSGGPRPDRDLSSVGWAGAAGAGIGATLIGAALVMNGSISRKIDNYEAALDAGELNSANRLYDEVNRQQTLASVTLISGSTLLLAGAGMIIYDLYYLEEPPRAQLGASVGPNSAGVKLRIRF